MNHIISKSDVMKIFLKQISKISTADKSNVLLLGEMGTGKELFANQIHNESGRKNKPFISVNCGLLKNNLAGPEIFGKEEIMSPTNRKRLGLLEVANGGTIFFDEVESLSIAAQSKLLSFIQSGSFSRIGGSTLISSDVRIICSSSKDLGMCVAKGDFREDLYYRINTLTVNVPTLRQRKEDIPDLINYFMNQNESTFNLSKDLTPEALDVLVNYEWKGNVKELKNVVEQIQLLSNSDTITMDEIPESIKNPVKIQNIDYSPEVSLYDLEKSYILKALNFYNGNKTQAAQSLGITIKTLYNKLHEFGL